MDVAKGAHGVRVSVALLLGVQLCKHMTTHVCVCVCVARCGLCACGQVAVCCYVCFGLGSSVCDHVDVCEGQW